MLLTVFDYLFPIVHGINIVSISVFLIRRFKDLSSNKVIPFTIHFRILLCTFIFTSLHVLVYQLS